MCKRCLTGLAQHTQAVAEAPSGAASSRLTIAQFIAERCLVDNAPGCWLDFETRGGPSGVPHAELPNFRTAELPDCPLHHSHFRWMPLMPLMLFLVSFRMRSSTRQAVTPKQSFQDTPTYSVASR